MFWHIYCDPVLLTVWNKLKQEMVERLPRVCTTLQCETGTVQRYKRYLYSSNVKRKSQCYRDTSSRWLALHIVTDICITARCMQHHRVESASSNDAKQNKFYNCIEIWRTVDSSVSWVKCYGACGVSEVSSRSSNI